MTKNSETPKIALDLSVGEVAARAGVAVSTLHFYETKGLIQSWRSRGNQRRYPRGVLRRVAVIRIAQEVGIPLSEIAETLKSLPDERTPTAEDWKVMSEQWRVRLDERIIRLAQLRDRLSSCIGCGCLSVTDCLLRNRDDRLASEGPGARLLERRRERKRTTAAER